MKVVLTGSTGFVGSEVLQQCCSSPMVDSVVVLTRRPLGGDQYNRKITNIILEDFKNYPPETVRAISNADACIWCLGGSGATDVEVDYPLAFANAMKRASSTRSKPFRYIHCSGIMAERNQSKSLWFLGDGRRAKGRAETELLQVAQHSNRNSWETYIMRPSMVLRKDASVLQSIAGFLLGSVRVDEVAISAVKLALEGSTSTTLENNDLVRLGDTRC